MTIKQTKSRSKTEIEFFRTSLAAALQQNVLKCTASLCLLCDAIRVKSSYFSVTAFACLYKQCNSTTHKTSFSASLSAKVSCKIKGQTVVHPYLHSIAFLWNLVDTKRLLLSWPIQVFAEALILLSSRTIKLQLPLLAFNCFATVERPLDWTWKQYQHWCINATCYRLYASIES